MSTAGSVSCTLTYLIDFLSKISLEDSLLLTHFFISVVLKSGQVVLLALEGGLDHRVHFVLFGKKLLHLDVHDDMFSIYYLYSHGFV